MQSPNAKGRILLVDDTPEILDWASRLLRNAGFDVTTASNGRDASELIGSRQYQAVVSDIQMPDMDGIELLRAVRSRDLDVPIILMTGNPMLETAVKAIEYGAFRYLVKPFAPIELLRVVGYATRLSRLAQLKREALLLMEAGVMQIGDRAGLEASFERALGTLWIARQPLVRFSERRLFGYEVLLRSNEATLPTPNTILDAAERLGRLPELGRMIRDRIAETATDVPSDAIIFVNLLPRDLGDEALCDPQAPLSKHASRIVLEITERSSLEEVGNVRERIGRLRGMGYRIAIDDLGAGYAGLSGFSQLEPEVVKLDMSLVRSIDSQPIKQNIVRKVTELCDDLQILVVGEGVETAAERDTLVSLGCDILQGFLFARPGAGVPTIRW